MMKDRNGEKMKRTPELQKFLDEIGEKSFGITHSEATLYSLCVFCKKKVDPTKMSTDKHKREWEISRICEPCQNETFGSK
jgi:hypothetical protein